MKRQLYGILLIVVAALMWGTLGITTRFAGNVDAITIGFYRFLIALPLIALIMKFTGERITIPKEKIKYILLGVTAALLVVFMAASIQASTIANALLLFYTAPVLATFMSLIFLKEKVKKESIVSLALCVIGIVMIMGDGFMTDMWLGTMFGLLAGFFYACSLTVGRSLKANSGTKSAFWQSVVGLVILIFIARPFDVQVNEVPALIALGILNTALAPILLFEGLRRIKTQDVGIILMLDPLTNIFLGLLIFLEMPNLMTIIGGGAILSAVLFQILTSRK